MLMNNDIEACFLLETKRKTCCNRFVNALGNEPSTVKWFSVDSENNASGILVCGMKQDY
jgi:hypothetical protein